jgi:hypothetical protein
MKTKNEEMDSEGSLAACCTAALKRCSNQIEPYVQEQPWRPPSPHFRFQAQIPFIIKTFLHVFRLALFVIYLQHLQSGIV